MQQEMTTSYKAGNATDCSPSLRYRRPQGGTGWTGSSPSSMSHVHTQEAVLVDRNDDDEKEAQVYIYIYIYVHP